MNRLIIIIIGFIIFSAAAYAQKPDTVRLRDEIERRQRVRDSVAGKRVITDVITKKNKKLYRPDSTHSPSLAFKRSAFVPGWGQLYNRKWWKLPLVYGGLGGLAGIYIWNRGNYKDFLRVYQLKRAGANQPDESDTQSVKDLFERARNRDLTIIENNVNYHERNMQLCILGFVGFWGIQMIDAYIDAKFIHSYTMDRDLSFKITPGIETGPLYASGNLPSITPVLKLSLTF
ncbi:DUF5683 domain-containing protein [uncultured Mucilaginibacter sp.]|uniref:DUF5683 domain-containing protein n=1 Tax=uncultured Mucilaginibacter sp. TaxID=797541 RepID=UPI0025F6CD0C|nr:DUF5683 domain-containing protein [uncultured Mucilaginibacter sp.]